MPRIYPIHPRLIDPRTMRPVPAGGVNVVLSTYWRRRLALGEATLDPPKPTPTKKAKKAAKDGDA